MILVSNIIAIFLQSLCIKLGSVTGLNLAENIKANCPPWLNYILWFFAEAAIVATDIAEVRSIISNGLHAAASNKTPKLVGVDSPATYRPLTLQ